MGVQNPRDSDTATPRDSSGPLASNFTSSQQKKDAADVYAPNIIIYGETGVGKSSLINLVAGQELAQTSNDAPGCTFQHQRYIIELDGMPYAIWDTRGLDEGSEETVPAVMAEGYLKSLIQGLADTGGVHLIVYCIRAARLTKALQHNYELFYVTVCRKKVPVALVVTGLEHRQGEMEDWWGENEAVLRQYRMWFNAHACVTTLDIEDQVVRQRRLHSQRILRDLVVQYSQLPPWKADPSFISSILPVLRIALRKTTSVPSGMKNSRAIRRAIGRDAVSAGSASHPVPVELSLDGLRHRLPTEDNKWVDDHPFIYSGASTTVPPVRTSKTAVVFGPSGTVKTLTNLLAGRDVAPTPLTLGDVTQETTLHSFNLSNPEMSLFIFDTPGLETTTFGAATLEVHKLFASLQKTGGIDLLIFCIGTGRYTAVAQRIYHTFYEILGDSHIPLAVATVNPGNEVIVDWWERNQAAFGRHGISPVAHASIIVPPCHTTLPTENWVQSQNALRKLFCDALSDRKPLGTFIVFTKKLWLVFIDRAFVRRRRIARTFEVRCGLSHAEAQQLAEAITRDVCNNVP